MTYVPEFVKFATNVYRTKRYIVRQCIGVKYGAAESNVLFSHDTYFLRTKKRDREYEEYYFDKKNIDGRRMQTAMHARRYVD